MVETLGTTTRWVLVVVVMIKTITGEEIEIGEGVYLEDGKAIMYENSIPIVYEMQWGDKEDNLKMDKPIKWSACYRNSTCIVGKTLSEYKQAVDTQINNLEPKMWEEQRSKRFNIIGWLLKQCCGVASQDDFETLYRGEDRVEEHLEEMRKILHADHRGITNLVTNQKSLTEDFNGILNNTKHEVTNIMMEQVEFSEKEDIMMANLLSIYKQLNKVTLKIKKNLAASSCQNKKIPSTMINPITLRGDLKRIEERANKEEWQLAIPVEELGKYYGIPTAACVITKERLVVRIKIPLQRRGNQIKYYDAHKIPIADYNSTCEKNIPSSRILIDSSKQKYAWIMDDKFCKPETNQLCKSPRNLRWKKFKAINRETPTICQKDTTMKITHLGEDQFTITHPEKLKVQCGEERARPASIAEEVHGYIKIRIPCECKIQNEDQEVIIQKQFPCDERWTKNVTIWHVIPEEWIKDEKEAMEIMKNSSMNYQDKLKNLLSENWNVRRKFPQHTEEAEEEKEEENDEISYTKIKTKLQEYHMEWTTFITLILMIIIFRQPLIILLSRIARIGEKKQSDGHHITQMQLPSE
uniref:Envelope protein n=1 Tax=Cacopsylla melanoneura TaxID=428564 RepID=A0A8D9AMN7_9HEMI